MSIGLVLVTHGDTAATLLAEAKIILDDALDDVRCVGFDQSNGAPDAGTRASLARDAWDIRGASHRQPSSARSGR